jgi:hypothetical protein
VVTARSYHSKLLQRELGRAAPPIRPGIVARIVPALPWSSTAPSTSAAGTLVALIKAVSANPRAPVIRLEDAEWSRLVVDRCVTTMIAEAERHIAENRTQAYHQKVLRLIQGAGNRGLPRNEITRRTQFLERKQREDILGALVEGGDLELEIRQTERRPAAVYRAVRPR